MRITVDTTAATVHVEDEAGTRDLPLASAEAFEAVSRAWLRAGWDTKHVYTFSWLGRPVIQLPEDLMRIQDLIVATKPDVIIETGVAHGGSLVFYACICKALGRGRVIGVDIEIRPHNREAIQSHPLAPFITLVEGSSVDPEIVKRVHAMVRPTDRVLVILDSCHTASHVLAELQSYSGLVTPGSYLIAMDGIMKEVVGAPRTQPDWDVNNPCTAVMRFSKEHPEFSLVNPQFSFNESLLTKPVTYAPSGILQRREVSHS